MSESSGSSGSVQFWVSGLPGAMGDLFLGIFSLATTSYQSLWTHWTALWTDWTDTVGTVDSIVDKLDNLVDTVDIGQCAMVR